MIVGFPFAFKGQEEKKHVNLAKLFIRALRQAVPGTEIVQMSDTETARLDGVDSCFRTPSEPFGFWQFRNMMEFPAEQYVRLDYDVVLCGDISEVFAFDFDIAIAKEHNGVMNAGAMFIKNRQFFADALAGYEKKAKMDNWGDLQQALQKCIDSGKYNVLRLDPEVYNYYPKKDGSAPLSQAKVLHYKGSRKQIMIRELTARFAIEDALSTGTLHKRVELAA